MADREQMVRRQKLLADFGEFALGSEDLDEVLAEACRLVSQALGTQRSKVLELQDDGQTAFMRAGCGWRPGLVGELRLPMSERSSEAFSLRRGRPVWTQDIHREDRFEFPDFMREAGVRAIVNVPILLPGRTPYGLLQVDDTEPREFGEEDTEFLRTYATILGPVIDRLLKLERQRTTEQRFRAVVEAVRDYAIFIADAQDRVTDWLPGAQAVFGWTAEEAVGRHGGFLFTPEDRARGVPEQEADTARREGVAPDVRWHLHKDGSRIFIDGMVTALRDESGEVRSLLKIGQDVTLRREHDARQRVLAAELQHRTRNLMGIVRSMVEQSLKSSQGLEDFAAKIRDRLGALTRVQGLLSRLNPDERVSFDELIRAELKALGSAETVAERVALDGPEGVALRSSTVQILAMALHELCTNAAKYGALQQSTGRLAIHWRLEPDGEGGRPWLHIDWRESGVEMPPCDASPQGGGEGRKLIEEALPFQLEARTSYVMALDGVQCTISLPISDRTLAASRDD